MRIILAVAMVALTLSLQAQSICAQVDKDKDKKKIEPNKGDADEFLGKKIEHWIKEFTTNNDQAKKVFAVDAILQYSPELAVKALPDLIKLHLSYQPFSISVVDPNLRLSLNRTIGVILSRNEKTLTPAEYKAGLDRLKESLKDSQFPVRVRAMEAMQLLGHNASAATQDLINIARDQQSWELRRAAILTLRVVAKEPKDVLHVMVNAAEKDTCFHVRLAGIDAVFAAVKDAKDKTPYILSMNNIAVGDPDPMVKLKANLAVITLKDELLKEKGANFEKINEKSIKQLAALLEHPDANVRYEVIKTVTRIGQRWKTAAFIQPLMLRMEDEDLNVKVAAISGLGLSGKPNANFVIGVLVGRLGPKFDPVIQVTAITSLGILGETNASAVDALLKKTTDGNVDIEVAAITALGNIGTPAEKAVGDLIKRLADANPEIRAVAMAALGKIGDKAAIVPLLKFSADPNPQVQMLAIGSIALMGPKASEAVGPLGQRLDDKNLDLNVREAIIQALGFIHTKEAVQYLIGQLTNANVFIVNMTVQALGAVGKDADAAVGPLTAQLGHKDSRIRGSVVQALGSIRSGAAINGLTLAFADKDVNVVVLSLQALGAMGPDARAAVPAINQLLAHRDNRIVLYAILALAQIGPDAVAALQDLQRLSMDMTRPQAIREAAAYAVSEISKKKK